MPNWNPNDIENQYNRAVKNDWVAAFKQAAADYKFTLPLLMAIASRETNMRSIVGDGGHGYGIMQIDDRSFPDWCHSGQWADVAACIQKELCRNLGDAADQAAWLAGISMTSTPFWNLTPRTTFGNWFSPFRRRQVLAAALTSLKTMSLAVLGDSDPFVRTVR
jgi:hypothetical protein